MEPEIGSFKQIVEQRVTTLFVSNDKSIGDGTLYDDIIGECEEPLIRNVLRQCQGNQVHAARALGINRNTLRKRIKKYGIGEHHAS